MKRKITGILILAVFISMFSVTGCYKDDEARVTIHIQRNDLISQAPVKQKSIIDRVLEFFSTPAYGKWEDNRTVMTLQISGSSFQTMNFDLPSSATAFTTIIPAANNVNFTVKAGNGTDYMWGGWSVVDVSPGEQEITINMIPMTWINGYLSTGIGLYWFDFTYSTPPANASGFYIYRSTNADGPYSRINTVTSISASGWTDTGPFVMDTTYYYKISVYGSDGEGVRSDPVSILYNP